MYHARFAHPALRREISMRRSPVALVALLAVAVAASACGGSGNSSDGDDTTATAASSGNGDVARILSGIDTAASTGPQKVKLDLTLDVKGSPSNAQLAIFTKKPIDLTV